MNKLINTLQGINVGGLILGVSFYEFTSAIYIILGIISLLISIVSGIIVIILRYKQFKENDGKIDAEEAKQLINDIHDLKDTIDNKITEVKDNNGNR